jgi:acetyltransferase-like isoleucine patch superfamily enzyme
VKKQLYNLLHPLIYGFCRCFFKKQYLSGRHFIKGGPGYSWALKSIWLRNILRISSPMPWPMSIQCHISNPENIIFDNNNIDNFQSPGVYFQNFGAVITLGEGSYIAPNVGLITANHKLDQLEEHLPSKDVILGKRCWIGMNAVILPGVVLGDQTVVAANATVTKSFPEGGVLIGGTPAKIIKHIHGSNSK